MTVFDIDKDGNVYDPFPELWEDIPGYEKFYQVSTHGRVRSMARIIRADIHGAPGLKTYKGRVLKPNAVGGGHPMVTLSRDGVCEKIYVARTVAFIWVDGYRPDAVVGHYDGDTLNCRADNLYWKRPGRDSRGRWFYGV